MITVEFTNIDKSPLRNWIDRNQLSGDDITPDMYTLYTGTVLYQRNLNKNTVPVLLEKFWQMSMYVTDDAIAKLYVTKTLVKWMVETFSQIELIF